MTYPVDENKLKQELIEVLGEDTYNQMNCSLETIVFRAAVIAYVYRMNKDEIRKQAYNQGV